MKNLIGAVAATVVMAGAASAATLTIQGGTNSVLPVGPGNPVFDPTPAIAGLSAGDTVTAYFGSLGVNEGLVVNSAAGNYKVTYTFLGKEAGAINTAMDGASVTNRDAVGTSFTTVASDVFLGFGFSSTTGQSVDNGTGVGTSKAGLAFKQIDSNSVFALFDDGTNDVDFDDMIIRIDVAAVPLPAGAALMLTALGGLGVAARRRK